MRIALVHDWLDNRIGGAEEVLLQIAALYPEADIYTLLYNKDVYGELLAGHRVYESSLRFMPTFMRRTLALTLPFIPRAIRSYDLSGYDLVISNSSAWSKNIVVPKGVTHLSYVQSPARMLWDSWPKYLDNFPIARRPLVRFFLIRLVSKIRLWDFYASDGVSHFAANSHYIAGRIKKFYRRESTVVYPPVHIPSFSKVEKSSPSYYLVLSTLAAYKNIDIVIQAFIENGHRLIVAGDGSARASLEEQARTHKNISFEGRVSAERKWELLRGASALVFANIEDFGITPLEANAAGTPVIALRGGGLSETMVDGKTAIFFESLDMDLLNEAVAKSRRMNFDPKLLRANASKYNEEVFKKTFMEFVDEHTK